MIEIRRHEPVLRRIGLADLDGARAFQGQLVKNHRGRREIFRVETQGSDGASLVFYFKRIVDPYKKDGLASLWRRGRVRSMAGQEWDNALALQAAGFRTAVLVAMGEDCGPLWERFSYLVTELVPGGCNMREFLERETELDRRRLVLDGLAVEIRRMHDAGLATPDLFARHIFVDFVPTGEAVFYWIDVARLDRAARTTPERRARDLAILNASAPLRMATARERLRFLRTYAKDAAWGPRLLRRTRTRTERLLGRRKFRKFFEGAR